MTDNVIVVRCSHCDQPTVRGEACRQCGKALSGLELPFVAHIPSAPQSSDWRAFIKPLGLAYAAAAIIWLVGFGKISSLLAVGFTVYFAVKYLRGL